MKASASSAQVSPALGLLTKSGASAAGHGPPFQLPLALQVLIERAIAAAWNACYPSWPRKYGSNVPDRSEVEITAELVEWLNLALDANPSPVPGWNSQTFETVVRGGEVASVGGSLEKRPDMTFRRCGNPNPGASGHSRTHNALFTECKIVDEAHPITRYWKDGMTRFTSGKYAWQMRHGLIVAYALGSQRADPSLLKLLREGSVAAVQTEMVRPPAIRSGAERATVYVSLHQRQSPVLGEFEIAHLWLNPVADGPA